MLMDDALFTAHAAQALESTRAIYELTGDKHFNLAEELLVATINNYGVPPITRLKSYHEKELRRKPTYLQSLGLLLMRESEKREERAPIKRRRSRIRSSSV